MVAFCRAALRGCKTSESELANASGVIDLESIKLDGVFKKMLEEGWDWEVVDAEAEEIWPDLPDFLQRALNAGNSVASEASELEIMASIAEFAHGRPDKGEVDWPACVEAACTGNPPCRAYAGVLGEFARLYGGGPGAPIVHELDAFAKQHRQNVVLGEEFLTAVVDVKFGEIARCPRVRSALLVANSTAPKSVDGIAKLLTKSDVMGLRAKDKLAKTLKLEQDLKHCEEKGACPTLDEKGFFVW